MLSKGRCQPISVCGGGGGGDTHMGYGILGVKKSGIWDMRANKYGIWDMGNHMGYGG